VLKASPASKKQRPHRQNEFSEHQNASNADALTGAGEFCKKLASHGISKLAGELDLEIKIFRFGWQRDRRCRPVEEQPADPKQNASMQSKQKSSPGTDYRPDPTTCRRAALLAYNLTVSRLDSRTKVPSPLIPLLDMEAASKP